MLERQKDVQENAGLGLKWKNEMKSILLLEDDENLNRGISLKLSKEGYRVNELYPTWHACFEMYGKIP